MSPFTWPLHRHTARELGGTGAGVGRRVAVNQLGSFEAQEELTLDRPGSEEWPAPGPTLPSPASAGRHSVITDRGE